MVHHTMQKSFTVCSRRRFSHCSQHRWHSSGWYIPVSVDLATVLYPAQLTPQLWQVVRYIPRTCHFIFVTVCFFALGPSGGLTFINKLLLLILSKVRLNTPPPIVAFLAFQTLRPSEFFLPAVVSGHLICSSLYMCRMLQYGIVQVQTTSF